MKVTFQITIVFLLAMLTIFAINLLSTSSNMAKQTIFNAEKNVWSYEEFHRQYNQYQQYKDQYEDVETRLMKLSKDGVASGQNYDNLVMEMNGIRQMMYRIKANYNAASDISYKNVWKSDGLPEKL